MKTTLDLADSLLEHAKRIALRDGDTLRTLVEQGLRKVVAERERRAKPFKLRDASFEGKGGLTLEPGAAAWDKIRDAAYEGRGG